MGLLPALAASQTELQSHTLSTWGGDGASGPINIIQSGGQGLIGLADIDTSQLGLGFLYTLPGLEFPSLALLSPSSDGVCANVQGVISIIGTVEGSGLVAWRLERAVGEGATSGFSAVSSGTLSISSGVLAHVDTSSLSGPQTLRLTAENDHGNVSVIFSGFTVGLPAAGIVLGGLNKPRGVAAVSGGLLAVADTNNDRVVFFSSFGAITAALSARKGLASLNKPSGLAVDHAGNTFVADTNNHRIVKLSPQGAALLAIGKKGPKDDAFSSGKAPGEFNKPSGVALDGLGNIYVSDTNNHRVQIFSPAGTFLSAFNLPSVPEKPGEDDGGNEEDDNDVDDEEKSPGLGRPVGIALDAAGNIYVADERGNRALKFRPSGDILATFGLGQLKKPVGIAVDATGDCILVSDTGHDRIVKFDRFGGVALVFGSEGKGGFAFNKPWGLALDTSGRLFAADRNNDVVRTFGAGEPAAVTASGRGGLRTSGTLDQDSDVPTSFAFRDAYVFPNPARRRERPTFRAQVGLADSVEVACYDVAGQLVHRAQGLSPQILDDGNGKGRQYTYDMSWNTDRIGSGVYACLVVARKAGHPEIRKLVKAGIIK